MPNPPETKLEPAGARRLAALWTGVLAGPVLWLLQLQTSYSLVTARCAQAGRAGPLAVSAVALLGVAGALLLSWRQWQRLPAKGEGPRSPHEGRERFMVLFGLLFSAYFLLVVLATALPLLVLEPCGL